MPQHSLPARPDFLPRRQFAPSSSSRDTQTGPSRVAPTSVAPAGPSTPALDQRFLPPTGLPRLTLEQRLSGLTKALFSGNLRKSLIDRFGFAGPTPIAKRPPIGPTIFTHSREGHRLRHEFRAPYIEAVRQRRVAERKALHERILAGPPKPTLEQRLAAIPAPTYIPIAPKPVLLNFEKLSHQDLARIFAPKFRATLTRLNVFETFQFTDYDRNEQLINKVNLLILRLTKLERSLKDLSAFRGKEDFQRWNYGFKQIGDISFKHLRKNQVPIIKALSAVYDGNYF